MKKSRKVIVAIIGGVALTAGLVACSWHAKSPEEKAEYLVDKTAKKLDLTEVQVVELNKLKDDLLDIRQGFVDKREDTHKTLNELFSQPTLDQQRLVDVVREHTTAVNEAAPQVISSLAGFYDNLTPEQQAILQDKISKHHHGSHHWYR